MRLCGMWLSPYVACTLPIVWSVHIRTLYTRISVLNLCPTCLVRHSPSKPTLHSDKCTLVACMKYYHKVSCKHNYLIKSNQIKLRRNRNLKKMEFLSVSMSLTYKWDELDTSIHACSAPDTNGESMQHSLPWSGLRVVLLYCLTNFPHYLFHLDICLQKHVWVQVRLFTQPD